ncbi:hypothetical protein LTR53_001407 [Teratosphaeriaceae sp. CCFEE 6253]|nr:hypothetical protein LTR53_001407 [Teratosphaeriaceae sp. CCFEE 6253]
MNPTLHDETFVWITISNATEQSQFSQAMTHAEMVFREEEGLTVILSRTVADELGMAFIFPSRKITLNVHSSLEASGFIAAVATRLATLGIGVNPVSGYYHDHLFVPLGREGDVLDELKAMAAEQQ